MTIDHRESGTPAFWDVRYEQNDHLFGTEANAFVAEHAHRLPPASDVVELGAGEGRTLVELGVRDGHEGTAVDFSAEALRGARSLAAQHNVSIETVKADVRSWRPQRTWDAAIVTFVQLLPRERPQLYRLLRRIVRPGGWIIGQWFRPDHLSGAYARIGPSAADRMVGIEELETHFAEDRRVVCTERDVELSEGEFLHGSAACVCLVAKRAEA